MTLGLALLCLATQLSGFAHLAFVPHVTCAEHGELVEAGAHLPATAVRRSSEDGAAELLAAEPRLETSGGHSHDHCIVMAVRRTPARLVRSSVPIDATATVARGVCLERERSLTPSIPLLDVAPKNSPPSA